MARNAKWGWLGAWALAASGWAHGAPTALRLCVDVRPHPPFILAEREGTAQVLVRMAAARAGLQVEYYRAPAARCAEEIKLSLADGYPAAGYTPVVAARCAFTPDDKEPDPQHATALVRLSFYRRTGDRVDWDGKRLLHTQARVLISHGALVMRERLRAVGLETDDGGADLENNFAKLLARRGDVALGFESDAQPLMERAPFAGRIEALPVRFAQERYYLCLSQKFRDANPELAAALWDAIPRTVASPEYRAAIKGLR